MAIGGNRGWFPVVRQRESGGALGKEVKHGLFTLFVDNLPAAMDAKTLSKLFNQFGLVKDAFIPFKRRIVSNSRFGFVRFDCPVAADIAIQKANGLLVDERVLEVKKATNIKSKRAEQSRSRPQIIRRPLETNKNRDDVSFTGRRSFAEVLKGVTPTVAEKTRLIIKANEEGNGWLSDSAIVRLNSEYSTSSIENVLKEKGLDQVLVRKGGGRDIVLTFKSQEELKSNICNIKEWFKNWSQFVVEWKPGVYLEQERCVWLRCYGLPISLWNRGTLNNIGSLWGTVLSLDDDICQPKSFSHTRIKVATSSMEIINKNIFLECKGKLHPILVCEEHLADCSIMKHGGLEECSSNEICGSSVERTIPEGCYRKNKGKSVMEVNTVVEESKCNGVFSGEGEACPNEVEQRSGPSDCHLGEQVNTVVEESVMEESMHSPKINVEQAFTPGFPRSCSGSRDGYGPGINLEVDLAQALSMNLNGKDFLSVNHSGSGRQLASAPKLLRYEKKKSKKKVQLEGFSSFARLHRHKAATISKHTSKSVIFRPAAAAIAHSDLSEDVTSPSNLLLNEAKATLQLGKSLGINFNGKEEDALNKIIELELQDIKRSK